MNRRELIAVLGCAAAAWPLPARAQQPAMPVVGFLGSASAGPYARMMAAFRQGLNEIGYVEDRNVAIEYRWAEGQYERLPALAAELVHLQVAVIAATGGEPSALAAKAATSIIPIVCTLGGDPVESGLVASFGRPGGNVTGTTIMGLEMGPKRLELLRQLKPTATTIAMLYNPDFGSTGLAEVRDVQDAARVLGMRIIVLKARTESEIDMAFTTIVEEKADGLVVATDPFLLGQRNQLVLLAASQKVPAIYFLREFVDAGGLMSYGPDIANGYRQAGVYTGRILGGANPATLPVLRPTKFLLFLNLKTATALGLPVSDRLLAFTDDVIE